MGGWFQKGGCKIYRVNRTSAYSQLPNSVEKALVYSSAHQFSTGNCLAKALEANDSTHAVPHRSQTIKKY